jgi:hypothetical protein
MAHPTDERVAVPAAPSKPLLSARGITESFPWLANVT